MNKAILFVGCDKQVFKTVKRELSGTYDIYNAENRADAFDIINKAAINLVVIDIDTLGMNGYTILRELKDKHPAVIRMIISDNSDENTLFKIQKECLVKSNLSKPLNIQELINSIERTFNVEKMLTNKNLLEVINKIEVLPFSHNIFFKFNELIEKEAEMKEIADTIESDPSLTAKVLQAANSVLYGIKTGSVSQAITYLGLKNVKNIVLMSIFYKQMENTKNPKVNKDLENLWHHAVTANKIIPILYRKFYNQEIPEVSSMAGLLHNIGRVVLISTFTDDYIKAIESINREKDIFYYYEEMEFLNVTHSEIGGYLLAWWEIPYPIIESALFHHNPLDERVFDRELVSLVNMANIYSWNMIFKGCNKEIDPIVLEVLKITKEDSDNLLKEIQEEII
ncbi:MAG: HDOD domain-containing protein [Solirubrobacterales bacterium]